MNGEPLVTDLEGEALGEDLFGEREVAVLTTQGRELQPRVDVVPR